MPPCDGRVAGAATATRRVQLVWWDYQGQSAAMETVDQAIADEVSPIVGAAGLSTTPRETEAMVARLPRLRWLTGLAVRTVSVTPWFSMGIFILVRDRPAHP